MSSDMQFNESGRESSYTRYNYYHCDKCDVDVSMKELSEHVATKHRGLQFDGDPSSDTDDSMAIGVGTNIQTKKQPTKNSKFGQKQQRVTVPDATVAQTSGDETDFHPFHPNLSMKKGLFDGDDGIGRTSTPNGPMQNVRSRARSTNRRSPNKWQTTNSINNGSAIDHPRNGNAVEMAQNRQRKIPTAHELFDYSRNSSEFRTPKVVDDGSNFGGDGKTRRYRSTYKRPVYSVKRTPVIPENFEACRFCSNVMHQDYIHAHIERKHRSDAVNESMVDVENIGTNFIANEQNNVDSGTANGMGAGKANGTAVGDGNIKKSNEPMFIRCKHCSAHMHIHYMPLHLMRKHRLEYDGSVGFCWTQYTDDQVNKLITANRVSVKNAHSISMIWNENGKAATERQTTFFSLEISTLIHLYFIQSTFFITKINGITSPST